MARFDQNRPYNDLPTLPPKQEVETPRVLKKAISASRALGEFQAHEQLRNATDALVMSIGMQEAKHSSEIENIVTTNDDLYQSMEKDSVISDPLVKEVVGYLDAVWHGHAELRRGRSLGTSLIREIVSIVLGKSLGIRTEPGTRLRNPTGDVLYAPPEGEALLNALLDNLSDYWADDAGHDPLVKMAVGHYQFEAIHPFVDGNGRTGRILNVLYLVSAGLLQHPVLFLSRYIIEHKTDYYLMLSAVTERNEWEEWTLYVLDAVETTARRSIAMLERLAEANERADTIAANQMAQGYSKELVSLVFQKPVTRISHVVDAGLAKRRTASLYLQELERIGLLESRKHGRNTLYVNNTLLKILTE